MIASIPKLSIRHHYRITLRRSKAIIRFGEGKASEYSAEHLRVELERPQVSEDRRKVYETALNMLENRKQ